MNPRLPPALLASADIAWCLPHADYPSDAALTLLRSLGLRLHLQPAGSPLPPRCRLRVLQARWLRDAEALRRDLEAHPLPTLVVADSAEQEAELLAWLPPQVEVVRGLQPAELVYERLRRLAERAPRAGPATPLGLDALTGCLDRDSWTAQLVQRLHEGLGAPVAALLCLNVDHFAAFNERHGQAHGDLALQALVQLLQRHAAPEDRIGRLAGDEFAWLLRRYDAASLRDDVQAFLAEAQGLTVAAPVGALRRWIHQAAPAAAPEPAAASLSLSAGLVWLQDDDAFALLMADAQAALLQAKRRGRRRLETLRQATDPLDAAGQPVGLPRRDTDLDTLTQLPNRSHLYARLARELPKADRSGRPLSLLLLDVQGLRQLNREHGHASGDRVLRQLADALRRSARVSDWLARWRGSGLCMVMPDTDAAQAAVALERLQQTMADTVFVCARQRPLALRLRYALALAAADQGPAAFMAAAARDLRAPGDPAPA